MGIYGGYNFSKLNSPSGGIAWKAIFTYSNSSWSTLDAHEQHWGKNPRLEHWNYSEQYNWLCQRWQLLDGKRLVVYFDEKRKPYEVHRSIIERGYVIFYKTEKIDFDPDIALHIIYFIEQFYQKRITFK